MEKFENKPENLASKYKADENGFVDFGDIARGELRQQSQYASRYLNGKMEGYPNLGDGLRFEGDPLNYHSLRIHKDDIAEFVQRVTSHKKASGSFFA
jgi:hypothetical protein